jgi:hypothetical protein
VGKRRGRPVAIEARATAEGWAPVRDRIRAALDRRDMDLARLAREAKVSWAILGQVVDEGDLPTETVFDRLVAWLDRQPDPMRELAKLVKAKAHKAAMTRTTLAGQIGVDVGELEAVIAGRMVSSPAAERLQAWAVG